MLNTELNSDHPGLAFWYANYQESPQKESILQNQEKVNDSNSLQTEGTLFFTDSIKATIHALFSTQKVGIG